MNYNLSNMSLLHIPAWAGISVQLGPDYAPVEKVLEEYIARKISNDLPKDIFTLCDSMIDQYHGKVMPNSAIESLRSVLKIYPPKYIN